MKPLPQSMPQTYPSPPHISISSLQQYYKEGDAITILKTRNLDTLSNLLKITRLESGVLTQQPKILEYFIFLLHYPESLLLRVYKEK